VEKSNSFLEIIQAYLDSNTAVLPVFNQTGLRVQQEVSKEDPDLRTIETLLSSDQALTTQVLRTANSAFYKGLSKVNSIREAIIRLGTNEVGNIVGLCSQQANYRSPDPFVFDLMKRLWQHSVGCAIGSQWLARQLKFETMTVEAFTAGLLHDVGKLLVLKVIEILRRSKTVTFQPSESFVREALDFLHTEQGWQLSQRWNLPDVYSHVIRSHHALELNSGDTLLILVRLADKACNKMGIGLNPDPDISLETSPEANILGLNGILLARLEIQLEDSLVFSRQE
jgi:HD-like signal output (HDOD) protein